MKRKVITGLVITLALALVVPFMAFAADAGKTEPANPSIKSKLMNAQLTEDQLQQLNAIHDQMLALRKQMIQKYVEFGTISQEDADSIITRMDEMVKLKKEKGFAPGMFPGMKGRHRGGPWSGPNVKAPAN
ncbi:MAG: DUF2680 domain-containing protein [Bacillota bacterium]